MEKFDLIVIGGGPGGYETAIEASKEYGMKTALIEARELGGTCLNRGCIPTKTLLHTSEYIDHIRRHGETIGITGTERLGYDPSTLKSRKDDVISELRDGVAGLLRSAKVTVYNGLGTIANDRIVHVEMNDGTSEQLEADNILIATGSVPAMPPIHGADLPGVVTSDKLLDNDGHIDRLVVIGGGVIGMELASVYSALGSSVTVIEALDRIVANLDKEISRSLSMVAKKAHGIDVHTSAEVTSIEKTDGGIVCRYKENESLSEVEGDMILMAVGRRPNTEGLFADDCTAGLLSIEMERGSIKVNDNFETGNKGIYAIGDVIGGVQLAHVATAEGRCALAAMNGKEPPVSIDVIPSCIYTDPEIASVGITSDEAKERGIAVVTKKYPMSANGKSKLSLQERGFVKVVAEEESGKIIGAQMMCARATDMISQFSQAIVNGLTAEDMGRAMFPHPTFSEGIGEVLK